jgi:hypothetical protein
VLRFFSVTKIGPEKILMSANKITFPLFGPNYSLTCRKGLFLNL